MAEKKPWENDEIIRGPWDQDEVVAGGSGEQANIDKPRNLFSLPDDVEKAIFPTTGVQATGERPGVGKSALAGLEALGTPVRALGKLRTNQETGENYKMSNPESNLLRPEMNRAKSALSEATQGETIPALNTSGMFGRIRGDLPEKRVDVTPSLANTGIEIAGDIAGDPVTILSSLKSLARGAGKVFEKPLKKLAVDMEQNMIRPRPSKIAKTGIDVENVLKRNMGGSMGGTLKKMNNAFYEAEESIQSILKQKLDDAAKNIDATDNALIDVDQAINNVRKRISGSMENAPDKAVFGQSKQVEKAIDDWAGEIEKFKMSGIQDIKSANDLKRLLGKKGFKSGTAPTEDTVAKELVADLIYLELMDDIAKKAPELSEANTLFKELLPIKYEMMYQAARQSNNNLFDLPAYIMGANIGGAHGAGAGLLSGISMKLLKAGKGNIAQSIYNFPKAEVPRIGKSGVATAVRGSVPNMESKVNSDRNNPVPTLSGNDNIMDTLRGLSDDELRMVLPGLIDIDRKQLRGRF